MSEKLRIIARVLVLEAVSWAVSIAFMMTLLFLFYTAFRLSGWSDPSRPALWAATVMMVLIMAVVHIRKELKKPRE